MMSANLNLIRKIVGIIGNITALCLSLSPTPTFLRIVKKKSVEEYSPIPYLAALINCFLWVLYGLPMVHPDSTLVITINGTGILIEILFLTIYFAFCGRKKQRLIIIAVLAAETTFMAVLAVLVFTLQHTTDKRTMSVGIVCCVSNVMMYISPLSVMKIVIRTKSVEFMPFWLSLAAFLNAVVWTIYALMPFDPFIVIKIKVSAGSPSRFGIGSKKTWNLLESSFHEASNKILQICIVGSLDHVYQRCLCRVLVYFLCI